jgi:hypothetical protein
MAAVHCYILDAWISLTVRLSFADFALVITQIVNSKLFDLPFEFARCT